MLKEKIRQLAKQYAPETIDIRRHLHAHPELSYKEFKTSAFVQEKLQDLGIPFEIKATTGVVGMIKGKNPDKRVIALRADMDALPIKEENVVPINHRTRVSCMPVVMMRIPVFYSVLRKF